MSYKLSPVFAAVMLMLSACGGQTSDVGASSTDPQSPTTTAPADTTTTSNNPETTESTSEPATTEVPVGTNGDLAISLQPVPGVFIEGFEIGVRVESADGTVLFATLWTDYIESLGDTSLRAYYDSVWTQEVPAGPIVVLATVSIGAGPGPITPDIFGPLACSLEIDVPAGGEIKVEIGFDGRGPCLSEIS